MFAQLLSWSGDLLQRHMLVLLLPGVELTPCQSSWLAEHARDCARKFVIPSKCAQVCQRAVAGKIHLPNALDKLGLESLYTRQYCDGCKDPFVGELLSQWPAHLYPQVIYEVVL